MQFSANNSSMIREFSSESFFAFRSVSCTLDFTSVRESVEDIGDNSVLNIQKILNFASNHLFCIQ